MAAEQHDAGARTVVAHGVPIPPRARGGSLHPAHAVPNPCVVEDTGAGTPTSSEENDDAALRVVGHRVTQPRARADDRPKRPDSAVPLPGISEEITAVVAAEEHHTAARGVIGHGVILARRWASRGAESPLRAFPLPRVPQETAAAAAAEQYDAGAQGIVGHRVRVSDGGDGRGRLRPG